jgi:hypothetical protein
MYKPQKFLGIIGVHFGLAISVSICLPAQALSPRNPGIASFLIEDEYSCGFNSLNCVVGYDFHLTESYTVGFLGFYDAASVDGPGISSHEVGIWDVNGNLLVSAIVNDVTGTLLNGFWWVKSSKVTLLPGLYTIGGLETAANPQVEVVSIPGTLVTDPRVIYGDSLVRFDVSGLELPTDRTNSGGLFGPNFAEVPGPLPIFGAAAAFGYSRKLRKRIKSSTNTVSTTLDA